MRRLLWVLAPLVVLGAPAAHADSYTPTFDCSIQSCTTPPIAPDVTFPSPSLIITFNGVTFDLPTFFSNQLPGDTYAWDSSSGCSGGPGIPPVLAPLQSSFMT
jgi:hypothetical protein